MRPCGRWDQDKAGDRCIMWDGGARVVRLAAGATVRGVKEVFGKGCRGQVAWWRRAGKWRRAESDLREPASSAKPHSALPSLLADRP